MNSINNNKVINGSLWKQGGGGVIGVENYKGSWFPGQMKINVHD